MTAAIRFFAKKYPELSFKETTVRHLKNLYQDQLHVKRKVSTAEAFAGKKQGRPLMIGEELDKHVQEYISYMRSGIFVNTAVVIACVEGILMPTLLAKSISAKARHSICCKKWAMLNERPLAKPKFVLRILPK